MVTSACRQARSAPGRFPLREYIVNRLLHNLSYPYNETAVNHGIPQEHKTVKYANLLCAVKLIRQLGSGCFMAKSDIKSAFRIVPLHPSQYPLMGFKWRGKYYYDKFLAMGLAESCRIFETISDAIIYILKTHFGISNIVKVLDDFLILETDKETCRQHLRTFLRLCGHLGIPIAMEKTSVEPAQAITFLGIKLCTVSMTACLPADKLEAYTAEVARVAQAKPNAITVGDLRSLVGKLQFATCVIPAGRPFLRRLINKFAPHDKPFWHLKLTKGHVEDLAMWAQFLERYNGVTIIRQPYICASNAVNLYTDASDLGFGGTFGSHWVQGHWVARWRKLNIAVRELYPVLLVVKLFGHKMAHSTVLFHCDNQAVVAVINKQTSRDKTLMRLLRPLILELLTHNIRFRAEYIPTDENSLADALSRFQETPHFLRGLGMRLLPTVIPPQLQPSAFIG